MPSFVTKALLVGVFSVFVLNIYREKNSDDSSLTIDVAVQDKLRAHSAVFNESKIIKVTDGVYVAIGYALANMIMIEGTDGIIIVDTTENRVSAEEAFADLRKVTKKPLRAVVVTHFHLDHINGLKRVLDLANSDDVKIFMHSSTMRIMNDWMLTKDANSRRANRQFGPTLKPGSEHINSGIGYRLVLNSDGFVDPVHPTHTYDNTATYTVAGITFQLLHTPGETDDQTTIWIPEKRLVLPADNIYEAFPNLYAVRGTTPRSCRKWFQSLDKVRELKAEYMVPSHTRPIVGEQKIYDTVTYYRDAIQFVHDQTIRLMNKGLTADEIVDRVKLPVTLASHPFLQEFYGTVAWSVRGVYDSVFGWFDGDPVNLFPLTRRKRAERWSRTLGAEGVEKLLDEIRRSLSSSLDHQKVTGSHLVDELQWSLELSSMVLELDDKASYDEMKEAKKLKVESLRALATTCVSANARNYYLTCAREVELVKEPEVMKGLVINSAMRSDMDVVMTAMLHRVIAERCDATTLITVVIAFTDMGKWYRYALRNCVVELTSGHSGATPTFDVKLTLTSQLWREVVTQQQSTLTAYAAGRIAMQGSVLTLKNFMSVFDTSI